MGFPFFVSAYKLHISIGSTFVPCTVSKKLLRYLCIHLQTERRQLQRGVSSPQAGKVATAEFVATGVSYRHREVDVDAQASVWPFRRTRFNSVDLYC